MKKKKLLTIMLSLAMAFSLVPNVGAKAADDTATATDATVDLGSEEQSVAADATKELPGVVINIDEPEVGNKVDTTLEFDDDSVFATCTGTAPNGQELGWFVIENGIATRATSFEEGKDYELQFMVNTVNGYTLPDPYLISVNEDGIGHCNTVNDNGVNYYVCRVNYSMPVSPDKLKLVESVDVTVSLPDVGTVVKFDKETGPTAWPKVESSADIMDWSDSYICKGYPSSGEGYDYWYEGTIESGGYYYVEVCLGLKSGYKFSLDTVLNINGGLPYEVDEFELKDPTYIAVVVKLRAGAGSETYTILDGADQTVEPGKGLTIRASGLLSDCKGIKIDGQWVDLQYLKFESGSTIVTVAAEYLSKLSAGEHTLTFVYYFGEVSTKFTIKASTNDSVKTGDTAPIAMFAGLMMFALCGMVALKKKEQ